MWQGILLFNFTHLSRKIFVVKNFAFKKLKLSQIKGN